MLLIRILSWASMKVVYSSITPRSVIIEIETGVKRVLLLQQSHE